MAEVGDCISPGGGQAEGQMCGGINVLRSLWAGVVGGHVVKAGIVWQCRTVEVAAYYRPAVHSARKHEGRTIARVNFAQRHAVSPTHLSASRPASRPSLSLDVSLRPPERTNERPTSSSTVVTIASLQHSPAITSGRIHPGQSDTAAAAAAAGGAGVGGGAGDCVDADRRTGGRHAYRPSYTTTGRSMETYRSARSLHTGPAAENAGPFPSDSCPHPLKSADSPVSDFHSDLTLIA